MFASAADQNPAAGLNLTKDIVSLLRADGIFTNALPEYAGKQKINRLAATFARLGMTLADTGELRPTVIDNFTGTDLTEALPAYVQRINLNPDDEPLQVRTDKELDEATARPVLAERARRVVFTFASVMEPLVAAELRSLSNPESNADLRSVRGGESTTSLGLG